MTGFNVVLPVFSGMMDTLIRPPLTLEASHLPDVRCNNFNLNADRRHEIGAYICLHSFRLDHVRGSLLAHLPRE